VTAVALLLLAAPAAGSTLGGEVQDAAGRPLAGVVIVVYPEDRSPPLLTTTGDDGSFGFELAAGSYTAVVSQQGYQELITPEIELAEDEDRYLELRLRLARASEVTVASASRDGTPRPVEEQRFETDQFELLRLPNDRFQETLPLLPGVVRDPRGRLSFDGTRPSQSLLLVNGSSATDPLTGEFAVELPLKAIEAVKVYTLPYSAQYGRVTGAVTEVVTRAGDDHWDLDLGGLIPKLRFRDGALQGISSAAPRAQVSGPLAPGKLWLSQGLAYRYVRSRAYDLDAAVDEEQLESFDSFTQLTAALGSHSLTTTFALFPVEVDDLGIDTLHPAETAPEFDSVGWNLGLAHRVVTGPDGLLETAVALKRYDVSVEEDEAGRARLEPEGLRGSYFNRIDRESRAVELTTTFSRFLRRSAGSHLLEVGADVSWMAFEGVDASGPVEVIGAGGEPMRTIAFEGEGRLSASDFVAAVWVNDEWRPTSRLGLTLGLRYDYDQIADEHHVSPRAAFAWAATPGGGTILKGGWGRFYDRVPLHAASFTGFQTRVETFHGSGGEGERRLAFANRLDAEGVRVPRSAMWHLELDQQLGEALALRVNYRERRGSRELVVERIEDAPGGPELRLASTGESTIRELDITLRRGFGKGGELLLSWSKRRASAMLDDFDSLYGNLREPLVLEAQHSLQPHDVPSRVLLWGHVRLPWKLDVAPAVEWRRGFPYTRFEADWTLASGRNRGGRLPSFFSLDLQVTREVSLLGRPWRIGVRAYNLTRHFNPRDVQVNAASPRFGELSNSVPLSLGLTMQVTF
jgi:outer membrane receptor protein involved in Fe transport